LVVAASETGEGRLELSRGRISHRRLRYAFGNSIVPATIAQTRGFSLCMQDGQRECAVACVKMIADYHGVPATYSGIQALLPESQAQAGKGSSIASIIKAASAVGLCPVSGRIPWATLLANKDRQLLPCMLHVWGGHFVLICRISSRSVLIADPESGFYRVRNGALGKYSALSQGNSEEATVICFLRN
jgi:hypothetical protein